MERKHKLAPSSRGDKVFGRFVPRASAIRGMQDGRLECGQAVRVDLLETRAAAPELVEAAPEVRGVDVLGAIHKIALASGISLQPQPEQLA